MDLNTLANVAEIIGFFTIVGGLWFAVVQIRDFRAQRREMASIELTRAFENPEFSRALLLVLSLPSGLNAAELRNRGAEYEEAAMLVSLTLESIAVMVHNRMISIAIVWELMGGVILGTWGKLVGWVEDMRHEQEREKFDEWFQWLFDQLSQYEKATDAEPAYLRYKDWRP